MNILMKKAFSRIEGFSGLICSWAYGLTGLFCILCLMLSYSPFASAQEVEASDAKEARVKMDSVEGEATGVLDTDDADAEERDVKDENISPEDPKEPETKGKVDEESERKRMEEIRRIMKEEKDPEIRKKRLAEVARIYGQLPKEPQPDGDRAEETQTTTEEPPRDLRPGEGRAREARASSRGERGGSGDGEGLQRYMDAIVKRNLFLPLGSGGEEKKTSFALTAVISNTTNESDSKAIIEQMGGGKSYYVAEGDTFADEVDVLDIEEQVVKLDRSGEEMTLRLGEGTQSGRGRGGRGGRSSGGRGERGPGGGGGAEPGSFDAGQVPEPVRRMLEQQGISIEDLRSNPDLRDRLRREMQDRFRRGAGGGPRQVIRIEGRSGSRERRRSR